MRQPLDKMFRLGERGGDALACDARGVALGPIALIEVAKAAGRRVYRMRPAEEIARTLALAYEPFSADDLARRLSGLDTAARALEAGDLALAGIATVLLKLPALSREALAKLAQEPTLRKYSADQPRDERGRWTDGGAGRSARAVHAISEGVVVHSGSDEPEASGTASVHVRSTDGTRYVYAHLDQATTLKVGTSVASGDYLGDIADRPGDNSIQVEPLAPPQKNIPGTNIPDEGVPEAHDRVFGE